MTGGPYNIYLISEAPRLTVDPATVQFGRSGSLSLVLQEQVGGVIRQHKLYLERFTPDTEGLDWRSQWPYDEFDIYDRDGEFFVGGQVRSFFRATESLPDELNAEEVLYVGQAFGKAGERDAHERLRSHSTLQRILSEVDPDKEVWLTICGIDDVMLATIMGRPGPTIKSKEEDREHVSQVYGRYQSIDFWQKEAVTGAEAGLIKYFQPRYNKVYKNHFPDPSHVPLSMLYDLEFHTLSVELQAFQIKTLFKSEAVGAADLHFALYPLGELTDLLNLSG
jgi:hypothetical protein